MRVLLATGIFPPDIGGPATYAESIAHEFVKRNIEFVVICYGKNALSAKRKAQSAKPQLKTQNREYDFPVIRISRAYPKIIRHIIYFVRLLKLAKSVDVIFAQNPVSAGLPAALVARMLGKKMVLKVVGDAAWERARAKGETISSLDGFQPVNCSKITRLFCRLQRYTANVAATVIVPSNYLKSIVNSWGITNEKIKVVYNAAAIIQAEEVSKKQAKQKIGIQGNIILSIGRLSAWKGFNALIEIMPGLIKGNPEFKLVIVGDGEQRKNLQSKVNGLGLKYNVKLIGKVSHNQIPFYFQAADVFILNSEYEGLSHVILEAMQIGVPVIASNKGGNPELIQNGFNGLLIEYNNKEQIKQAILGLQANQELQQNFIFHSQEKLSQFNFNQMIEGTLKVLSI